MLFAISAVLNAALEFAFGNPTAGKQVGDYLNVINGAPVDASFTIGTEAGDAITVNVQIKDAHGNDLAAKYVVHAFLSDNADGDGVVGTAASGGIAAGTDGAVLIAEVAGKISLVQCEADGDLDLVITHSGAKTCYLGIIMPNGKTVMSGAITFA